MPGESVNDGPRGGAGVPQMEGKLDLPSVVNPDEHLAYVRARDPGAGLGATAGAIVLYQSSVLRRAAGRHRAVVREGWCDGLLYVIGYGSSRFAVCGDFGIGAPAATVVLEQLIALGVSAVITIGTAASLDPALAPGDTVLCDRALRDEGTSHHYLPRGLYASPDPGLTDAFGAVLQESRASYRRGTTWSTDALYRETAAEIGRYREDGVLVADMEASGIFAVASYRRIPAAAGFIVADSLVQRLPRRDQPRISSHLDHLVDAAATTLVRWRRSIAV